MQAAGEDVEFFYRLAFHARFYFINAPLLYYREHSGVFRAAEPIFNCRDICIRSCNT